MTSKALQLGPIRVVDGGVERQLRVHRPEGDAVVSWRYVNGQDAVRGTIEFGEARSTVRMTSDEVVVVEGPEENVAAIANTIREDPSIEGFFLRRATGEPTTPLAHSYRSPDDVFDVPDDERRLRVVETKSFVVLRSTPIDFREIGLVLAGGGALLERFASSDPDARFFVRAVMPFEIVDCAPWIVGLWLEIDRELFETAGAAWDTPEYGSIRLNGRLANALDDVGFDTPLGTMIAAASRTKDAPLYAASVDDDALTRRLAEPWPHDAFVAFAVEHALL